MTVFEILFIIFIHWIADFVCQTHEQAMNKSKDNYYLLEHVMVYTGIWYFVIALYSSFWGDITIEESLFAVALIFTSHYYTDYITSRVNARLWKQGRIHDFFVSVGFDQCLHYTQLFLTYYFIK